ncbi:putative proline-rich receptor-like protein kinase PERK3 [Iris pallida]|uniref:Proline-rich receptor-like protein kinase PERK3 n=1 Tax=Iris pallida TaxID=29817 RepID=A0AAX6H9X4_IRIPA|nr:putative proline-rich receptor-like protein kinase PERK3 [Iris pallida]
MPTRSVDYRARSVAIIQIRSIHGASTSILATPGRFAFIGFLETASRFASAMPSIDVAALSQISRNANTDSGSCETPSLVTSCSVRVYSCFTTCHALRHGKKGDRWDSFYHPFISLLYFLACVISPPRESRSQPVLHPFEN